MCASASRRVTVLLENGLDGIVCQIQPPLKLTNGLRGEEPMRMLRQCQNWRLTDISPPIVLTSAQKKLIADPDTSIRYFLRFTRGFSTSLRHPFQCNSLSRKRAFPSPLSFPRGDPIRPKIERVGEIAW
jgi:hypothetical protein